MVSAKAILLFSYFVGSSLGYGLVKRDSVLPIRLGKLRRVQSGSALQRNTVGDFIRTSKTKTEAERVVVCGGTGHAWNPGTQELKNGDHEVLRASAT